MASGTNIDDSPIDFLVRWIAPLAIMVSVITAIDTWFKPRDKWRGFMEDRDDLKDLIIRIEGAEPTDVSSTDDLRSRLSQLCQRHRENNVF